MNSKDRRDNTIAIFLAGTGLLVILALVIASQSTDGSRDVAPQPRYERHIQHGAQMMGIEPSDLKASMDAFLQSSGAVITNDGVVRSR